MITGFIGKHLTGVFQSPMNVSDLNNIFYWNEKVVKRYDFWYAYEFIVWIIGCAKNVCMQHVL